MGLTSTQTVTQTVTSSFGSLAVFDKKSIATTTTTEVSLPITQRALTVASKKTYHVDDSYPVPEIQSGNEILIKTCAVGLNPIDWKSVDWNFCLPAFPWVTGGEMSGVVAQVGEDVTEFKEGNRVWTSELSSNRSGRFKANRVQARTIAMSGAFASRNT